MILALKDSDETGDAKLTIDGRRFGFRPGEVELRDFGAGGLAHDVRPDPVDSRVSLERDMSIRIEPRCWRLLWFRNVNETNR